MSARSGFVESRRRWILAAIIIGTVSLHLPLLRGSFISVDDVKQILANKVVTELSYESFKTVTFTNFMNRNHNPMYLSFLLNWAATPNDYSGFLVVNLVWLTGLLVAFYKFAGLFVRDKSWQLFATALFSLHSVHVDIVAWISARCHLMGLFFFLLVFVAWQRYRDCLGRLGRLGWYLLALVLAWLAVWNKNIFFSVGAFVFLYDMYKQRRLTASMLLDKIPLIALGAVPLVILHNTTPYLENIDRAPLGGSIFATLLNDFGLLVQYLYHLLVPATTYIWVDIYPISSPWDTSPGAGLWAMRLSPLLNAGILLCFAAGILWLARRHRLRLPLYFILFSSLAYLPVMNIPPKWVEFAFRYDLIPSAFYCVALAAAAYLAWMRGSRRARLMIAAAAAVLLLWHGVQSTIQILRWRNEEDLARACVEHFWDAKYCQMRVARLGRFTDRALEGAPNLELVESLRNRSNSLRPSQSAYRLGMLYQQYGYDARAKFFYERALLRDTINRWQINRTRELIGELEAKLEGAGPPPL